MLQLFGADELRRELSYRYGDVVTSELPGAPCSPAVLAGAVVDVLDTHGLIGDELFPWLREKRPFQTMKIDPVARAWADVGES